MDAHLLFRALLFIRGEKWGGNKSHQQIQLRVAAAAPAAGLAAAAAESWS